MVEHVLEMPGDRRCTVRVVRADTTSTALVDTIVDIDLSCFVEATFSRWTVSALLQAADVFVLDADGTTVGTCIVLRSAPVPHEAMLLTMGILPGWRGRGLGQWFVSSVLDALALEGFDTITLLVGSDNTRALHLYRELGFHVVDDREADPATGDRQLLLRASLAGRS